MQNKMSILSLDVGVRNMGVAALDAATGEPTFAASLPLIEGSAILREGTIPAAVHAMFFEADGPCAGLMSAAAVVLIEQQMVRKFLIVQHVIAACCIAHGKPFRFVAPRSVKAFFATGKPARRGTPREVAGRIANYAANKRSAVAVAREIYPSAFARGGGKQDDVADALLQARWFWVGKATTPGAVRRQRRVTRLPGGRASK